MQMQSIRLRNILDINKILYDTKIGEKHKLFANFDSCCASQPYLRCNFIVHRMTASRGKIS